jgi:alkylation response protein AidB-like acyl-CoA dehydrogenase
MSTRRSPSSPKNSETTNTPKGGEFLLKEAAPTPIFTPEDFSAEQRLMARTMQEFLRRDVLPIQNRLETLETGLLRILIKQAGELGLLAGSLPEPYGLGLPKTTLALLAEMSAISLSFAVTIGVHGGVAALPLLFFGTEEQKNRYLPKIASGDIVAAFALTEANAGSDAFALETRATRSQDGRRYILDGAKLWVTNAGIADLFTVFANVESVGVTAFLLDRATPGLSVGPEENKLGLRGSSTGRLMLNKASVDKPHLLAEPGSGHRPALYALNPGRFQIGAIALGGAKEALKQAIAYSAHRRQAGRAIAGYGLIQQKLAEMLVRIFVLESMVYRTAGYWDAHLANAENPIDAFSVAAEEYAIECALIKVFGTETLGFAADEALQIHGGYGYSEDYPIARLYRDARVFRIFEGTNEINRLAVFQQIVRRLERGRLIRDVATIPRDEDSRWPRSSNPLSFALKAIGEIRRLILVSLDKFKLSPTGSDTQLAEAAVADLCALLYGLESSWMRAKKLMSQPNGSDLDALLWVLQLASEMACATAIELARTALAHVGANQLEVSKILGPLNSRPLVNVGDLYEIITRVAVRRGGYCW